MSGRTAAARFVMCATIGLVIGAGAASVQASTAEPVGSGDACTDERRGGEAAFAVATDTDGFDPTISGSVGAKGGHERIAIFDTLMWYDRDTSEFVPWLAESLEPNDDFTAWTLTLREGVSFGSGAPVTTAAVEFAVSRHGAEESVSNMKTTVAVIDSMEIVDDLTMVFHLSDSWGNLPWLLAGSVGMIYDPAVFEELGAEAFGNDPGGAGAGPYSVSSYTPGEEIVLTAKDDYWGGPVCIETLRLVSIADEPTRLDAFLNGEIDAGYFLSATSLAELREGSVDPATTITYGGHMWLINHGANGIDRPGSDLRVRQAFAYALDPVLIDERATGGLGMPSSAMVNDRSVLYSPGLEGPAYDPDLARELLDAAKADGFDGKITLTCENLPGMVDEAIAMEAMLETAGFDVTLDNNKARIDKIAQWRSGDFEFLCLTLLLDETEPWVTMQNTLMGFGTTLNGYESPEMEAALDALREAQTVDERRDALLQAQQVWNDTIPSAIVSHVEEGVVSHDTIIGLQYSHNGSTRFDQAFVTA